MVLVYVGNGCVSRSSDKFVNDGSDGTVRSDGRKEACRRWSECRDILLRTMGRHNILPSNSKP